MALPLSNTTITIKRPPANAEQVDGYDPNPPAPVVVATGVRAVIGPPSASARIVGGDRVVENVTMQADPCDLIRGDIVLDANGQTWTVLWVTHFSQFAFDHVSAGLRIVVGAVP